MKDNRQMEMFDRYTEPLARNTDPATSHLAAHEMGVDLAGLRRRVYKLVQDHPGKIARELSVIAGDNDARTINRRLGEVEKLGLIYRGVERRCKITGRLCATWFPSTGGKTNGL